MTRVYIAISFEDKDIQDIERQRTNAVNWVHRQYRDAYILDSVTQFYFSEENRHPLLQLADMLEVVFTSDVIVFSEDWNTSKSCRILHQVAKEYDFEALYI